MCCDKDQKHQAGGTCLVYKDPVFMTAQFLSIVAIFLSWGYWATGLLGFVAFIMLQCAWCCRLNKCGLITAGVFAFLDALGCAIFGVILLVKYTDDDGYVVDTGDDTVLYISQEDTQVWAVICLIGALIWTVVAVLIFVFACGRLQRYQQQEQNKDATETAATTGTPIAVAIPSPKEDVFGEPADV